jgi:glycerophosphoryl diester phosphodiesterase
MSPVIYAHRGDSRNFPENTLAAFHSARELRCDGIEFDVHATADGELVIIHDYDLSRTTTGVGLVHERDLAYVRGLDAGSWFGGDFEGERVPVLSDVLALEDLKFELEVKGLPTRALVEGIAREVQRMDVVDRVKFTSFHLAALGQLQQLLPEAQFGLFSPVRRPWMSDHLYEQVVTETAVGGRFDVVHIPSRQLHLFDVNRLHERGLLVQTANPETPRELELAADRGVDSICTDDPAAAIRRVRE